MNSECIEIPSKCSFVKLFSILRSRWVGTAHCAIHGYTPYTIDFSHGFWYCSLPCPFMLEDAKLLAASTSALEWCKSCAHTSFLPEVIYTVHVYTCTNSTWRGIVSHLFTIFWINLMQSGETPFQFVAIVYYCMCNQSGQHVEKVAGNFFCDRQEEKL